MGIRSIRKEYFNQKSILKENAGAKTKEAVSAVVPIVLIVLLLGFTIAPLSTDIMARFITGAFLVIIGMIFFSMGANYP